MSEIYMGQDTSRCVSVHSVRSSACTIFTHTVMPVNFDNQSRGSHVLAQNACVLEETYMYVILRERG